MYTQPAAKKVKYIYLSLTTNGLSEYISPTFTKIWVVFMFTTAQ